GDAALERELRLITERAANFIQVCFGEVLVMRVRILDVIGLKFCAEAFVKDVNELIERARLARTQIVNAAPLRFERENTSFYDILHVNEIALLIALFKNARSLTDFHLLRQMINHARGHALVRLARTVNIEVAQAD